MPLQPSLPERASSFLGRGIVVQNYIKKPGRPCFLFQKTECLYKKLAKTEKNLLRPDRKLLPFSDICPKSNNMKPIHQFTELTTYLKTLSYKPKIVVVCANDSHTEHAVELALEAGIARFLLLGDKSIMEQFDIVKRYADSVELAHFADADEAAREAVRLVRQGEVDILMKGLINTDNLLRAILDKEVGILPKGRVLTHLSVVEIPTYHKLLFFSDAAVVPYPTLEQRREIVRYAIAACNDFGIEEPKVALIHFTEKVNPKFPNSVDYVTLSDEAKAGSFGRAIVDGPMDVRTACEAESGDLKGISSPVGGDADILIFPNIESGNTFYKTVSLFAKAEMAGLLQGPICPVVVNSRSDSSNSKFYSLAMACLQALAQKQG